MKPKFSLNDFRQWMSEQKDLSDILQWSKRESEDIDYTGCIAKTRVGLRKLVQKIKCDPEDDPQELAEDFATNGGTITDSNGHDFMIEVDKGSFALPCFCVKVKKDDI